ncbi:uncharacterized protein LOC105430008 [Pogonomyrmex barbatus]|uniref:Uncharacterized protein LOC105430008 n=1 Tax=Pogonomyrmex barbatus TaxID=144034 RepID=A0A6I9WPU1_9HYME|nr:uncharacterized protein LOC105430008 [Pogonomyrmex barbatus]XP_025074834.1 uncharacterized protein LOC105430008 [Pogonomyrmex barbatus]XP_025074835.1 uncharacterized protein LOC105430008 [Pogonomyrmex barbatus]
MDDDSHSGWSTRQRDANDDTRFATQREVPVPEHKSRSRVNPPFPLAASDPCYPPVTKSCGQRVTVVADGDGSRSSARSRRWSKKCGHTEGAARRANHRSTKKKKKKKKKKKEEAEKKNRFDRFGLLFT